MKRLAFFLVLWCIMSNAMALAQNLLLQDYQPPVSTADSLLVDLNYNYATSGNKSTENQGHLQAAYHTFYESLRYGHSLDILGIASRNNKSNDYQSEGDWRLHRYLWQDRDWFGSVSSHTTYSKGFQRPTLDIIAGFGVGRFVNVTPLYKAKRIEDYLLFGGQIRDDLPAATMLQLAQVIERQAEYRARYAGTYRRLWYDDMAQIVRDSGMLVGEEFDAVYVLRMDQVLLRERISDRFYGWDITLGMRFQAFTEDSAIERAKPAADITVRYSRPISWRTQFNEQFSMNSAMNSDFLQTYNLLSSTDLSYEVTNRIDLVTNYRLRKSYRSGEPDSDTTHSGSLIFVFYLENQINLTLSFQASKSNQDALVQNSLIALNYRAF